MARSGIYFGSFSHLNGPFTDNGKDVQCATMCLQVSVRMYRSDTTVLLPHEVRYIYTVDTEVLQWHVLGNKKIRIKIFNLAVNHVC